MYCADRASNVYLMYCNAFWSTNLKTVLGSMVIICTPWQSCMTIEESQMVKGQNVPLGLFNQSMSICVIIWEGQIVKGQIVWLGGLVNNVPALVCRPWGCSGEKHQFTATQMKSMQRAKNREDYNFIAGFPDWHESGCHFQVQMGWGTRLQFYDGFQDQRKRSFIFLEGGGGGVGVGGVSWKCPILSQETNPIWPIIGLKKDLFQMFIRKSMTTLMTPGLWWTTSTFKCHLFVIN